jgi:uncharacterized protein
MNTSKRDFLKMGCFSCLLVGSTCGDALATTPTAPKRGLFSGAVLNACEVGLPPALRDHPFTQSAFEGLQADKVWDVHAHLLGNGDSGSGCKISPKLESLLYPLQFLQKKFFLNGACVDETRGRVDLDYVARLQTLMADFPAGYKLMLLAFDHAHTVDGTQLANDSAFYVPNKYCAKVASASATRFAFAASIHPYREDAAEALGLAVAQGAKAIKWLPSAMGIDPANPRCDAFYQAAVKHNIPIISHAGQERAVKGVHAQQFGNPLRLQRALDLGVKVIVAHCASMGEDADESGTMVESFSLFEKMMVIKSHEGQLFGDVSAITQTNRAPYLKRIMRHGEWQTRLLNGSDYPLPGVIPLFDVGKLVSNGWLRADVAVHLTAVREYNALLFDFLLKRHLRINGARFEAPVFETARVFRS